MEKELQILRLENGDFLTQIPIPKQNGKSCMQQAGRVIKAAIPGTILSVNVNIGQYVKRGDALFVLDSMKMNNTICADADGVVKSVNIAVGDAVAKGTIIIEFE